MRRLILFLFTVLVCVPAKAQMLAQEMGAPSGSFFTESFGDTGGQPCGYGAPWNFGLYQFRGCNVIWGSQTVGTGALIGISASPGSKISPQGQYSLQMVTGTSATYLSTIGFTPTVSAATPFDLQFSLYISTTSLSAYDAQPIYTFASTPTSGQFPCRVDLHSTAAGTVAVHGEGSSTSADTPNLALKQDHVIFLHCAPGGGAGASYVTLDGGSPQTFTANATAWTTQIIGAWNGDQQSMAYSIGNVRINAPIQGTGNGAKLYSNFEGGSNGATVSAALLNSSTLGGDGSWGGCSTGTYQAFSTAAQLGLAEPVDVMGTQYTDANSSLGIAFTLASAVSGYCPYSWLSFSPTASAFEWIETNLPTTDHSTYVSMNLFANVHGSDFASHMVNSGSLYLESSANPNGKPDVGSFYAYTPSQKYGLATQYQEYSAGSVPGGVYLVQGALTSGAFAAGELLTQSSSGATARLLTPSTGSSALQIQMISGTATSTSTWVGQSSGAVFTPTSLPTTFHTLIIYDANCNVLSKQMKIANANTPTPPGYFYLGRGGDQNASGLTSSFFTDNLFFDYASGNMIPCH